MTKYPRYRLDPDRADPDNPDGVTLNTGEWIPTDDALNAMDEVGKPAHKFLQELEDLEAPHFRMGRDFAQSAVAVSQMGHPRHYVV